MHGILYRIFIAYFCHSFDISYSNTILCTAYLYHASIFRPGRFG